MAIDEKYVPITLLNQYFVNKDDGLPLANGTLEFYRDVSRGTTKTVYQLSSSGGDYTYVALPNPVDLSIAGTVVNGNDDNVAIYAYPFINDPADNELTLDLYYVVCKDSDGNVQWTREAIPSINNANNPIAGEGTNFNELSNPQFSEYFLTDDSVTLTLSGSQLTFPIAPDWDFVASGTGTVLIERVPVSGNSAIPTYPSYYLQITVGTGVTSPFLRQRLAKNSGLWSGQYVAGFFVGKVGIGSNGITMKYQDASGVTSDVTIFDASLTTDWDSYGGSVQIDDSSDTLSGDDAYVDINIYLPLSNTTYITSLQVTVSPAEVQTNEIAYDQRSSNREQALMGDYYIPALNYRNAPSLMQCWDFTKNPRQFGATGSVVGATAAYAWDQTILQVNAGLTVNYTESTISDGLKLNHANADSSYALIQYLDTNDAAKFVGTKLSVNINGYTTAGGNAADDTTVFVKIFANSASNQFGTLPTSLVTIGTDGAIALTGTAVSNGWYEITRNNLPVATGTLVPLTPSSSLPSAYDLGFNNWQVGTTAQVNAGIQGIAVVVSFVPAASTTDYNTCIDSISVVPGDVPCRPAPQSYKAVLEEAQRYYEKSYEGTSAQTTANEIVCFQPGDSSNDLNAGSWGFDYQTYKRTSPTVTIYSPNSGTSATVYATLRGSAATSSTDATIASFWTLLTSNTRRVSYAPANTTTIISAILGSHSGYLVFHYSADARIGIV